MNIELEKLFIGVGEVAGFEFKQIAKSEYAYIYQVSNNGKIHFEVFKKNPSPVCIDFEKRIYSDTDTKDSYPKSNSFGLWAYSVSTFQKALSIFHDFKKVEKTFNCHNS